MDDYEEWFGRHKKIRTYWKDLGLATREANALANHGIESIPQLTEKTAGELLAIPNLGKLGLQHIRNMLSGLRLHLRAAPKKEMPREWQDSMAQILREHGWTCEPPESP